MSKIVVDLENTSKTVQRKLEFQKDLELRRNQRESKRGLVLKAILLFSILAILAVGIGAYIYWQDVKSRPQYSLALLVDAAKRNDSEKLEQLIDVDAIVDSFIPQVTDKAIEIYGRSIAPERIKQIATVISSILPEVKQRIRAEMPQAIREKTKPFEQIPWWVIVFGADRVLETRIEGDTAYIRGKDQGREIELVMKRKGDLWQVVGIKDERLAQQIAEKIGQEVLSFGKGVLKREMEKLGISGTEDLMKKLERLF